MEEGCEVHDYLMGDGKCSCEDVRREKARKEGKWYKIFLTTQEFHDKIIKLAAMIPKGRYRYVYGIPRGGLIIAVYLSHLCNLEVVTDIERINGDDTLVVDDIADTGKTLNKYPITKCSSATIHYKPRSIIKPTYYVDLCENTDWIVYPYECSEEKPNREV
jgi:hypoxanthine phosphoribosyltransferase